MPDTCGADIEEPVKVLVALGPPMSADGMSVPGANRSTHGPKLDPWLGPGPGRTTWRASVISELATVSAAGTRAGDEPQAFALSLPAATTTGKPLSIMDCTTASVSG